ncbi:hypothetical protein [Bacillus sp. FJAT-22090]|uniref:hypothetical protein n=1 Tax=Bacillus sp. FJAT-22090 TaxID=1581038 RepID=UPI0016435163|nr:hypothetical protein [Bacillus sp. FJAT-22090]
MQTEQMARIRLNMQKDQLEALEKDFWRGKYDGKWLEYSSLKSMLISKIETLDWVLSG